MRVTRKLQAEHRTAMLRHAARLFRGRGVAGVAVADVAQAAGLTHGAFYGHFDSKAALVAEACRDSLEHSARRWREHAARATAEGHDPLDALIERYLTAAHRDGPDRGCALAALGAEAVRDPVLRDGLAHGTMALLDVLAEVIATSRPAVAAPREAAAAVLAALTGGLVIARALADSPAQSDAALAAAGRAARSVTL